MVISLLCCIAWSRLDGKSNNVHMQPRKPHAQEVAGRSRQVPYDADELAAFAEVLVLRLVVEERQSIPLGASCILGLFVAQCAGGLISQGPTSLSSDQDIKRRI
jgi:hypothetical protein